MSDLSTRPSVDLVARRLSSVSASKLVEGPMTDELSKTIEARVDAEVQKLTATLTTADDPVLGLLLRFHLLVEELLDRVIAANAKRPQYVDELRLSFAQKISLFAALEAGPSSAVVDALKRMNRLRNKCAHEHGKRIDAVELGHIGECFGDYAALRTAHANTPGAPLTTLAVGIFAAIYGPLISAVIVREHK